MQIFLRCVTTVGRTNAMNDPYTKIVLSYLLQPIPLLDITYYLFGLFFFQTFIEDHKVGRSRGTIILGHYGLNV